MTKAKYKKGRLINSLDELIKQQVVWQQFGRHHKIVAKNIFDDMNTNKSEPF